MCSVVLRLTPRFLVASRFARNAFSVELILSLLAQGETQQSILQDYPGLEPEDIRACLAYAHAVVADDRLEDVAVASG